MKIMIVDDKKENLFLLQSLMRGVGFEAATAQNGQQALDALRADPFGMIISDILMPVMDGFQLCRECKMDDALKQIPFVFYTATYTEKKDEEFALSLGADRFILKPTEPEDFVRIIMSVLQEREQGKFMPRDPEPNRDADVYKQYNERLVKKLEHKMLVLEESESRYRALFEASTDGILIADIETRMFKYANPAMCRFLGYTETELTNMSVIDIHREADLQWVAALFEACARDKSMRAADIPCLRKDGAIVYADVNAVAISIDGRACNAGFFRDITERKIAAKELRANEERYSSLFAASMDAVLLTVPQGRIITANQAACEMFGYTEEELIQIGRDGVVDASDPRLGQALKERSSTGRFRGELTLRRRDGATFPGELSSVVFSNSDGDIFTSMVIRDMSERKLAEEEIKSLSKFPTENPNPVLRLNRDGIILYANPGSAYLLRAWHVDIGDRIPDVMREVIGKCIEDAENKTAEVVVAERCYLFVVAHVARESYINIYGTDITDQKRAEESLRRSEEQLYQSQKMESIGKLAGGIAHDFNNLLTVILGNCDLMLMDLSQNDPFAAQVEEISDSGRRAASLTRQLLAFSRRQVMDPEVLDVNHLVSNLDKMLRRLIGEDIDYKTSLAPVLGRVKADPGQIEQVIVNLVINARDAMPGGGKLTIESEQVALDDSYGQMHMDVTSGDYIMIAVTDTGSGMDAQTQMKIFEPFFTTKEKGKGTGLGLSTVFGIIKQSGGNIMCYSELGKGTTFKIYLPVFYGEEQAAAPKKEQECVKPGTETVLVVEDNDSVRNLIVRILKHDGYKVIAAENGGEALLAFKKHCEAIDLLISDIVMPGMSGKELADSIKADAAGIKTLFMSGYTDTSIVHHGQLDAETNFLQKPFTPDSLIRKVRDILDN